MMADLKLSSKYKEFLKYDTDVEFLEGTTAAGKTTVGAVKFLFVLQGQTESFTLSVVWTWEQ